MLEDVQSHGQRGHMTTAIEFFKVVVLWKIRAQDHSINFTMQGYRRTIMKLT